MMIRQLLSIVLLPGMAAGLERRFGDAYGEYQASIPRWIPALRRSPR